MRLARFSALALVSVFLAGCQAKCNVGGGELKIEGIQVKKEKKTNLAEVVIKFKVNHIKAESAEGGKYRVKVVGTVEVVPPKGAKQKYQPLVKPLEQTDKRRLNYAEFRMIYRIPNSEPRGEYKVTLKGKDEIAGKEVQATTTFKLD